MITFTGGPDVVNSGWKYQLLKARTARGAARERSRWFRALKSGESLDYAPMDYYGIVET